MGNNSTGSVISTSDLGMVAAHPLRVIHPLSVAPSTEGELNTFSLDILPVACMALSDLLFEFDSSFVGPDAAKVLTDLPGLREKHKNAKGQLPPLSVFGHADPVGSDHYNKTLSGRRAMAIYGLLTHDVAIWDAELYGKPYMGDNWKNNNAVGSMKKALGPSAPSGHKDVIRAYMELICPFKLEKKDFLGQGADPKGRADYLGCSEFNPLLLLTKDEDKSLPKAKRNSENQPNRRVVIYLFRPGDKVDARTWPCPAALEPPEKCHERFFVTPVKGDDRRKLGSVRREHMKLKDTEEDTFACRFYDRISHVSPCEGVLPPSAKAVVIKAENGTDPAPTVVAISTKAVKNTLKLKGVPPPGTVDGSYKWSTKSTLIKFEDDSQNPVTVIAGETPSESPETEEIVLVFTPTGLGALPAATHQIGVALVTFSKEDTHPWGYDPYEKTPYEDKDTNETEPQPGPEMDFISIKTSQVGKVKVTIKGAKPADVFFKSADESVCVPGTVQPDESPFVLEINAKAKNKKAANLEARLSSTSGTVAAKMAAVVLKQISYKAELFRVYDSKSADTALAVAFTGADLNDSLNECYKQGVAAWEVTGGTKDVDVNYDISKNGILDLEPETTTPEERRVIAACKKSQRSRIIYVHELRWNYYLRSNAKATDTKIYLKRYDPDYINYFGAEQEYTIEDNKGKLQTVKIKRVNKNTGEVEIDSALGESFKVSDKAALIFPLGGLGGEPLYITDTGALNVIQMYAAHELGHSSGELSDLCEKHNIMYGGGDTFGNKMRHRPIAQYYEPTKNEEQWMTLKGR